MTEPARQSESPGQAPEIEELQRELAGLKERLTALGELAEREHLLREQARDISARDVELSAARQELHQHERGLTDELSSLVADQLARGEQQERRAETVIAALIERAATLDERERDLAGREAEVETRKRALADAEKTQARSAKDIDQRSAELAEAERKRAAQDTALESDRQALAAKEADVEAKAQARERALAAREGALAERERERTARAEALEKAAQEQAAAADEVARERASFEEREAKLEARAAEIETTLANERRRFSEEQAALAIRESALREREQTAATNESAHADWLAQRDREVETLREHERRLAAREETVARREKAVENVRVAVAENAERQSRSSSLWNLNVLEGIIATRGGEFPDRVEEWDAYLLSLGDVADDEGRLPRSLDPLLDGVFAPFADAARADA